MCSQPSINDQVQPAWLVLAPFQREGRVIFSKDQECWRWLKAVGTRMLEVWRFPGCVCLKKEECFKMMRKECQDQHPVCNLSCLVMSTWNVSKFASYKTTPQLTLGKCRNHKVSTLGNASPLLANSLVLLSQESKQSIQTFIISALLVGQ